MCIQFVYINNAAEDGEYQVIIANNRDESFNRKTRPAEVWGIDLEPGREGGTWIAVNTETGRIGTLLNILTGSKPDPDKLGRGNLVVGYITGSKAPQEYLHGIAENAPQYNPFNLLLMEYRAGSWHSYQYSTASDGPPTEITDQVYGVSNSAMDRPWQKVVYGKNMMSDITARLHTVDQEVELTEELIGLLNDPSTHMPDPQLELQAGGRLNETLLQQRSAVCVDSRQSRYGTRTNTVILIEKSGTGKYIERTMREPVEDVDKVVWDTRVIPFVIDGSLVP